MTNYSDTRCWDCGRETSHLKTDFGEWYMVWDSVWRLADGNSVDFLCIGCLEARLGRKLVPLDFNDAPLNRMRGYGRSLRLRLRTGLDYE